MKRFSDLVSARVASSLLGLSLVAPVGARAATYQVQRIAALGERVGDVLIDDHFDVDSLNDNGQFLFITANADGDERLVQYEGGKLVSIAAPGGTAPGGKCGTNNGIEAPVSMNQLGNIVFATDVVSGNNDDVSTFFWDHQAKTISAIVRKGMPAPGSRILETGGDATPAINNRNEIALVAAVKNADGDTQDGIFFRGSDGTLKPVALPDEPFPDGRPIVSAFEPTINDAGMVGFLARRQGDGVQMNSAYLWENGTITPVAVVGQPAPGGAKIVAVWGCLVNNNNRNAVVALRLNDRKGPDALYLFANGHLTAVAAPGQPMPDGRKFKTLQSDRDGIGFANESGQHPLLAILDDNSTAAYRLDPDGSLTLLLKSGTKTDLGTITQVGVPAPALEPEGVGIALNAKGQFAVTARVNKGPITLLLLSPAGP
jgi:hypothetical protein